MPYVSHSRVPRNNMLKVPSERSCVERVLMVLNACGMYAAVVRKAAAKPVISSKFIWCIFAQNSVNFTRMESLVLWIRIFLNFILPPISLISQKAAFILPQISQNPFPLASTIKCFYFLENRIWLKPQPFYLIPAINGGATNYPAIYGGDSELRK